MKKIVVMAGFLILCGAFLHPQVTCFTADDFMHQRERLLTEVNDGVILLDAAVFPAEFFYLTGVQSNVAKLILIPDQVANRTPRPEAWQTTLYLPVKTSRHGVWDDTPLCYKDNTENLTGISANAPLDVFYGDLTKLGNITNTIYIPFRPSSIRLAFCRAGKEVASRCQDKKPSSGFGSTEMEKNRQRDRNHAPCLRNYCQCF